MARVRVGFQTRLVFLFVLLAIVPIGLITFFYLRYLTGTIEYWQSPGIERSLENSLGVARESLEHYRTEAAAAGDFLLILLDPEADALEASEFLRRNLTEVGVQTLGIYRRGEEGWTRWAAAVAGDAEPAPIRLPSPLADEILRGDRPSSLDLASRFVYAHLPSGDGELILRVGVQPPAEVMERIRTLASDVDVYRRLAAYERIQTGTIVVGTLAVVALVVLASFFVARALARSVSRPILELVEGTRRISTGDLDHRVQVQAGDEVGLLVRSFNQMTEDLRASKENLRRAERVAAWRDVARRIAHEIKNPLTPVQLSIHRLRKRIPAEDPRTRQVFTECLDLMHTEVSNLRRLADEFSQFARMPAPQPEPSDLAELSRAVLDLYRGSTPGIEMSLDAAAGLPTVPVDPDQFRQALGNLIKNAVEAMPSGGRVAVRLEAAEARARPGVLVSVSDTGPGLPEDIRDRVFDPYVTSKKQGTGLGLSIVHRVVTDHAGRVDVESAEGGGTTFHLFFPLAGP